MQNNSLKYNMRNACLTLSLYAILPPRFISKNHFFLDDSNGKKTNNNYNMIHEYHKKPNIN